MAMTKAEQERMKALEEQLAKANELLAAAPTPVPQAPAVNAGEELVELYIARGEGDLRYNVHLEVNGEWVDVPRGRPFMVKRKFRDLYQNNMAQQERATRYADKLTATNERGELLYNAKDVRPE